jgi:hypothetical protein
MPSDAGARGALVVAHPSHELRVHGWLELARPPVVVVTDGSGRSGTARLAATTAVLRNAGAEPSAVYGAVADLDLYAALLRCDAAFFVDLVERMAAELADVDYVVRDAAEGYSSAHDVAAVLADVAAALVERRRGRRVARFDFLVVGSPEPVPAGAASDEVWIHLDDAMFLRKIWAARGYDPKLAAEIEAALAGAPLHGVRRFSEPEIEGRVDVALVERVLATLRAHPELHAKVERILGGVALDAFKHECLRPVGDDACVAPQDGAVPFYEIYGEQLVATGRYREVIRFRDHVAPIAEALRRHVDGERRARP